MITMVMVMTQLIMIDYDRVDRIPEVGDHENNKKYDDDGNNKGSL